MKTKANKFNHNSNSKQNNSNIQQNDCDTKQRTKKDNTKLIKKMQNKTMDTKQINTQTIIINSEKNKHKK